MPTEAEFDAAIAQMVASSAWINGTEAEREALAHALFSSYEDIWDVIGEAWADLWQNLKDWLLPPKNSQHPVSKWFTDWWLEMFQVPLLWSVPPGGGPGGSGGPG